MHVGDIKQKLLKIFRAELSVGDEEGLNIVDCPNWDSVAHINLIFDIEEVFDIEIKSEDIKALHGDFSGILHYVHKAIKDR